MTTKRFDPAAFLARYDALDAALVARGFPATSPWWRAQIERFVRSGCRRWVIRAGRRAGKSSTLCRLAVAWALWGSWHVPPGDTAIVPFVSVDRGEAAARLKTIAEILNTVGVSAEARNDEIELVSRRLVFRVVTCSIRGTVGFTSIASYGVRITVEVDGVKIKKRFDLKTDNPTVARTRRDRLVASMTPTATEATRTETFREAAQRVMRASEIRTKNARLRRLELHIYPYIGEVPVDKLRAADVATVLAQAAHDGQSKQSVLHLRNDVSAVLDELWRDEVIPENVARKVRIPKGAKVDRRERAVLSDEELVVYFGWQHPEASKRDAVLERQTMSAVSRMFGGLRLGDIKAIQWQAFDIDGGNFPEGWAPRKKTARPQLLEVPAVLRPILRDWWERAGRPHEGPVFPVRRGPRAGKTRKTGSPAKALRRDLKRAFGIEVPQPFRRAFKQGLADAGVELQTAMTLSGATDAKTHARYLVNTSKLRTVPVAALPSLAVSDRAAVSEGHRLSPLSNGDSLSDGCRRSDLNRRPRAYEARALTS